MLCRWLCSRSCQQIRQRLPGYHHCRCNGVAQSSSSIWACNQLHDRQMVLAEITESIASFLMCISTLSIADVRSYRSHTCSLVCILNSTVCAVLWRDLSVCCMHAHLARGGRTWCLAEHGAACSSLVWFSVAIAIDVSNSSFPLRHSRAVTVL